MVVVARSAATKRSRLKLIYDADITLAVLKGEGSGVVYSIGVDIVETSRIREMLSKHANAFLRRVFTEQEISYCNRMKRPEEHLAARFAAKEAVMKAIGAGMAATGARFHEIEVGRGKRGNPTIRLRGKIRELARAQGVSRLHVSLSHTKAAAIAFVVAEAE